MNVRVESPPAAEADAAEIMTRGGDGRITLDPATGLNRYHSAPRPSAALAYASSTANDASEAAYKRVERILGEIGSDPSPAIYAERLESLRARIRKAYSRRRAGARPWMCASTPSLRPIRR